MSIFIIKQGDRRPVLRATLVQDSGAPYILTGCTVRFHMAAVPGATAKIDGGLCDLIDAANGIVEYVWGATDTSDAGQFKGEFEITWPDGKPETVPNEGYALIDVVREVS